MIRIDSTMQMRTRYRLRWWLVYWWLAGCVLVNIFALVQSPLIMTFVVVVIQVVPFLLGGILVLWLLLLVMGKVDLGVWLTSRQYILFLLMLLLFGLSPTLFVYGSSVWAAKYTLNTIEVRYGVEVDILRKGPGWYDDPEWGPGLNTTWRITARIKTENPKQLIILLASDLQKHGWEGGSVTETHYGFQCSNVTAPRLPIWGSLFSSTNVFHAMLPEEDDTEIIDEAKIYLSFNAVNPFSSRCRL